MWILFYSGKTLIEGIDKSVIDMIYADGSIPPEYVGITNPVPNHYFILKNGKTSALHSITRNRKELKRLKNIRVTRSYRGMLNRFSPFMPS